MLLLAVLVGCSGTGGDQAQLLASELAGLDLAHPESDVAANLAKGDARYICVYGYAATTPGTDRRIPADELRCLEGTSDAVESSRHEQLNKDALRYARTYNIALDQRLESGVPPNTSLERTRER